MPLDPDTTQADAMASAKTRSAEVQRRRTSVAQLLKAGVTQRQLAEQLGVSKTTINSDVAAILKEWRAATLMAADAAFTLDIQRIDDAIRAIAPAVLTGDLRAVETLTKLLTRRAAMFGYDAAHQVHLTINPEALNAFVLVAQQYISPENIPAFREALIDAGRADTSA